MSAAQTSAARQRVHTIWHAPRFTCRHSVRLAPTNGHLGTDVSEVISPDRCAGRFDLTIRPSHNIVCLLAHVLILEPPSTTYAVLLVQRNCEALVDLDLNAAPRGPVLRVHTWPGTYPVCSSAFRGFERNVYVTIVWSVEGLEMAQPAIDRICNLVILSDSCQF